MCSYIGYKPAEIVVNDKDEDINIDLEVDAVALGEVVIVAENTGCSEVGARTLERNSLCHAFIGKDHQCECHQQGH